MCICKWRRYVICCIFWKNIVYVTFSINKPYLFYIIIWRSLADLGEDDQFWGQNDHLMILFWFFELIFVLSAPKYIGYDIKIVTFRKLFFRPLLKNNKKRKNFINSVHDHFRDKRLIKMIYQKNLVKVIDWEVFALNHTWFQFLRIFWNCVRFWSFFVENGILRGY